MKKHSMEFFVILATLAGSILACGAPTQLVTLNLKEDVVNDYFQRNSQVFSTQSRTFTFDSVDLQEGLIRLNGKCESETQSTIPCSIDFKLSAVDGNLHAEVIAADVGEIVFSQPELDQFSRYVEKTLTEAISNGKQGVEFTSVDMLEDLLKVQFRFLPEP